MAELVLVCSATSVFSKAAFSAAGYIVMNWRSKLLLKNLSFALFLNQNHYLLDTDTNKKSEPLNSIFSRTAGRPVAWLSIKFMTSVSLSVKCTGSRGPPPAPLLLLFRGQFFLLSASLCSHISSLNLWHYGNA